MVRRLLTPWTLLLALAFGLLSVGALAPISDLLDKAMSWVAIAILLAYVGVPTWDFRQVDQSSSAAIPSSDQT